MLNITINNKKCECEKGEYILHIARRNGIGIPTLCHSDGLPGQACCRICIVEVIENGRSKIVTSCVYPVEKELQVVTNSEKIIKMRAQIASLLLSQAPESKKVKALCKQLNTGINPRFKVAEKSDEKSPFLVSSDKCILCGLCAKVCSAMGTGAITTANRGVLKNVSTPFEELSAGCIGCKNCAAICPTEAITYSETADMREIWGKRFELVSCESCGKKYATEDELAYFLEKLGTPIFKTCPECRKRMLAKNISSGFAR